MAVVISDFSPRKNRFNFHIAISHPLTRLTIRYDGWPERAVKCKIL